MNLGFALNPPVAVKPFPPAAQVFQALLMAKLQQEQDPTRARARIDPQLYDTMTRCARP